MTVRTTPREHGTKACYVFGPTGNSTKDGCRCRPCKDAQNAYNRELANRIVPAYVSATQARQHVEWLGTQGVGLKQIARASGVSHGALSKLIYGMEGREPSKRIRPATAEKILAVHPSHAADGARVDATATWRLIDEMVAAGVPRARIAEALGNKGPGLQLRRDTILRRSVEIVAALHAEWTAGRTTLTRRSRWADAFIVEPPEVETLEPVSTFAAIGDLVTALAQVVELRNDQAGWRHDAACRTRPGWMWFPARGDDKTAAKAIAVCRACTVRERCLAANLDASDGIYGGLSAKQRRTLRAQRPAMSA